MKKYLFCFAVLVFLFFKVNIYAESIFGIGYGKIVLPSNSGINSLIAPDGENTNAPYIYWNIGAGYGFGYGLALSGYSITKYVSDSSGTTSNEWNISNFSIFTQYQIPLSSNKSGPLLGFRLGGTIAPVSYNSVSTASSSGKRSASQTRFGPYFGADIQIPLGNTSFVVFGTVEKSVVTSTVLSQSVNVGALSYAAGLGYHFR
ncbi:MAG: hypothetical protein PHX78_08965 [bacterium]|nr:hypothetical protein [bacterium]